MSDSVSQALSGCAARLVKAGFEAADAQREAEDLYSAIVMAPRHRAWLDRDEPIPSAVLARLDDAVTKREAGWPAQYAAGRANFRGHWLAVDQRVLIPRPETEGLVEVVLGALRAPVPLCPRAPLVADIGTGSGAIAIALALEAPVVGVIATDISGEALNVALENALATGTKERISFRRGPLCAPLLDDTVDVLVSNPPYVSSSEWVGLEAHVRDYEPRLALDGGASGMDVIRLLVAEAVGALNPGGLLALETDAARAPATADLARQAGFEFVEVRDDLFGRPRYVVGRRPEH